MLTRVLLPDELIRDSGIQSRNVCAYARVSTLKDVAHLSFDAQVQVYTQMIIEHPNWHFVGVFADEGKSGTNTQKRTQFHEMLDLAIAGHIDLIITKSISRFARNVVDMLGILQALRNANVEVWFENENISSFDSKIEFVISLLSGMAEEEARNVSENVKWNVQKRFAEGKYFMVTKGFLGYQRDGAGNLVVNEEEAKVVRMIYEWYTQGVGVTEIMQRLNQQSIPTTYNKGKWYANAVYGILKNEKYTGNALLHKTVRPSFRAKLKVKNEIQPAYYVEHAHPPIVTLECFEQAQAIRKAKSRQYHRYVGEEIDKRKYNQKSPYAGKLRCSICGQHYVIRRGHSHSAYSDAVLACASNKLKKQCPNGNISLVVLEQAIQQQMRYIMKHRKEVVNKAVESLEKHHERMALLAIQIATKAKIVALEGQYESAVAMKDDYHEQLQIKLKEELCIQRMELAKASNLLLTKWNPELTRSKLNSVILNSSKEEGWTGLFQEIVNKINVVNKDQLEFWLVGVPLSGSTKSLAMEVKYRIRKTDYYLKHQIRY